MNNEKCGCKIEEKDLTVKKTEEKDECGCTETVKKPEPKKDESCGCGCGK